MKLILWKGNVTKSTSGGCNVSVGESVTPGFKKLLEDISNSLLEGLRRIRVSSQVQCSCET